MDAIRVDCVFEATGEVILVQLLGRMNVECFNVLKIIESNWLRQQIDSSASAD